MGSIKEFKLVYAHQFIGEGILEVTANRWQGAIRHVISEEQKMWELDGLCDAEVDQLVINVGDSSSTSEAPDSGTDTDMEGIVPISDSN